MKGQAVKDYSFKIRHISILLIYSHLKASKNDKNGIKCSTGTPCSLQRGSSEKALFFCFSPGAGKRGAEVT